MLFTADEVAERLGLHVRTVRNYIRDGRLTATRVGKQYRISRADLEVFTGQPVTEPESSTPGHVEVSSIVEIDGITPAMADRLSTHLTSVGSASTNPRLGAHPLRPVNVNTIYQRDRAHLKVVIVGDLAASAYVFGVINTIVKEPPA